MPEVRKSWNPAIQSIRGIAVLLVVFFHLFNLKPLFGLLGVGLFFCVSGYLMSGIIRSHLVSPYQLSFFTFLRKRLKRLFPALLVTSIFILFLNILSFLPGDNFEYLVTGILYVFFVGNIAGLLLPGSGTSAIGYGHLWTLALEMQLYIALFMIYKFSTTIFSKVNFILISIFVGVIISQLVQLFIPVELPSIINNSLLCISCFLIGSYISTFESSEFKVGFHFYLVTTFIIFCPVIFLYANEKLTPLRMRNLGILLLVINLFLIFKSYLKMRIYILEKIGLISYSLYLLHFPIFLLVAEYAPFENLILKITLFSIVIGLSYLNWRFVERRFWTPSTSST